MKECSTKRITVAWAMTCAVLWLGESVLGCRSTPIESDEPNAALLACCHQAKSRIEVIKDVRTDTFRRNCQACRRGNTVRQCSSGATEVQREVAKAFGPNDWPLECDTLPETLKRHGVEIPSLR